jgi:broad specificity phosphatase PhoE
VGEPRAGFHAHRVKVFVLARHGHSELNAARRVNGDPSVPVRLTEEGRRRAAELGHQVAGLPLDLCVHTRFGRTRETAEIALGGRMVPLREEPLLDDVAIGDLEGKTIDEYHAWKHEHSRADPFPGGESLVDTARRYAKGFRALVALDAQAVLVVCHEIPIRYALNAAAGSDELDGPAHGIPNATPYVFGGDVLARAAERIALLADATSERPA